jgi:hypothetical protein
MPVNLLTDGRKFLVNRKNLSWEGSVYPMSEVMAAAL